MTISKMSKTVVNVGIDVGKAFLDVHIHEKALHWQENNTVLCKDMVLTNELLLTLYNPSPTFSKDTPLSVNDFSNMRSTVDTLLALIRLDDKTSSNNNIIRFIFF